MTIAQLNFPKKKTTYTEKYRRGVYITNHEEVIKHLQEITTWVEIKEAGVNSDGTEFYTVTLNNIKVK
jgi:hypothetical protein